MAYAILRIAKHKSCNSLAGAERHGKNRERLKHLSHPERTKENRIYRKYKDKTLVQSWKTDTQDVKVRRNAVYMLELVLTFSPEATSSIEPKLNEWINACMNWTAKNFGGKQNILQARIDLDEATPHCHIFVLPRIDDRLCAREFCGNKKLLSELQTSFAQSMSQFGLERGKCYLGSDNEEKPRHKSLNDYYREIEATRQSRPIVLATQNRIK